jgi:hypothetical protein
MSDDIQQQQFRLHFEGPGTVGHTITASILVQTIQALQRSVQIIAAAYEGNDTNKRIRTSFEMEQKYALKFSIPENGSYDIPYTIGKTSKLFDPQDLNTVKNTHQNSLEAIQLGDAKALRRIIPSAHIRNKFIREIKKMQPPPRSGIIVSIENYRHEKLLDGSSAAIQLETMLTDTIPHAVHPRLVTGILEALDFQNRSLKLKLSNGKTLNGTYSEDYEPVLLENPRELIQIRGDATINDDNSLKSLDNITEIIEIDESPIVIHSIIVNGSELIAKTPYKALVEFDIDEGYYSATGDFYLMVAEDNRDDLERSIHDTLVFLWRDYVLCSVECLTLDAIKLRNNLQILFGVNNAS